MSQLHETMYGKNLFEYQLPALIDALEGLAKNTEKLVTINSNTKQPAEREEALVSPFSKTNQETIERLQKVIKNPEKAAAFANAFYNQVINDDEKPEKMGFYMARAILNNNLEEFLIAVCGWTSKSLLDIAEGKINE